jgi:hypothetical protein
MKKKLETTTIQNELKGQSLYFEKQSKRLSKGAAESERMNARSSEPMNKRTHERVNRRTREHANARTAERVNARTNEQENTRTAERVNGRTRERRNAPRIIKRHSYQFYVDQVEDMKNLWRSYQARGIEVDLAYFAREAFDEYLARIKEKANESTIARTDERVNRRTDKPQKTRLDRGK